MITQKRFTGILAGVAVLLMIPFIAMQFNSDINWSVGDFIVMGGLLLGAGLLGELVIRRVKRKEYRLILIAAIIIAFLLVWAELAVGIFGSPFEGS